MIAMHQSPYCGSWYPDDPGELQDLLDRAFHESERRTGPCTLRGGLGFVVPHAGLAYSGVVAAAVYRQLRAQGVKRIILAGFCHSHFGSGISLPDVAAYSTAAGTTEVDRPAAEELARHSPFRVVREDSVCDHSVEIQMPLLRAAVPEARVVPLYVGRISPSDLEAAAEALVSLLDPETVMVASSDFTHYGRAFGYVPFPKDNFTAEHLRDLDEGLMEAAGSLDVRVFEAELERTRSTLCGRAPIGLLLATLSRLTGEEIFQERFDYQTSGEVSGDWGHCVSYSALGYFPANAFFLDSRDQKLLLDSARRTLDTYGWEQRCTPVRPEDGSETLGRRGGAFVSLHLKGRLMGCIGTRGGREPLAESVPELAISALHDPRFSRPAPEDVAEANVEISLLTPMKWISDPKKLKVGIHGGFLDAGGRQGLLLPQVATEHGMDREEFLRALARKAGAPADTYRRADTRLSVFQAQRFSA